MTALRSTTHAPLTYGSRTDLGCVRGNNEDSLLVKEPVFAVADGMGGHAAGEIASEIAIQILMEAELTTADPELLKQAVVDANEAIIEGALTGLGKAGMGTTLTAAIIEDNHLLIAQVGDSRAYLLCDGRLRQITRDHSLVEELISAGQITSEEARVHPNRSVITRVLGNEHNTQPDIYELALNSGDRLLVCSDGLSGMLELSDIASLLQAHADPQEAADALVEAARDAGGYDNITVIVVNVVNTEEHVLSKQKRRFRWGIAVFLLVFVLLIASAIGGVFFYAHNAAFLIEESGYVSIYRGLPGDVAGVKLQWLEEETKIKMSDLPPTFAQRVQEGAGFSSVDNAREALEGARKLTDSSQK